MTMTTPTKQAYFLDPSGARAMSPEERDGTFGPDRPVWLHLDQTDPEAPAWLAKHVPALDAISRRALLAEETRPRLYATKDQIFLVLRGVNLNEGADPEDMVSVRLWSDGVRIVSAQRRRVRAIEDIARQIEADGSRAEAGPFLVELIRLLLRRIEAVVDDLDERTDALEEEILQRPDATLRARVVEIRRKSIWFRRHLVPQRDVISQLRMTETTWLSSETRREVNEVYDFQARVLDDLETVRERCQVIQDELQTVLAERLNRNIYTLSIVAALFLPLGFLTGLLGINVGGIPGAENPYAFGIFIGLLVLVVALQIYLFKRWKWF